MTIDEIKKELRGGGSWLGAARSWLQWHKHNGGTVTWGSEEVLSPPMTVKDCEELARDAVAAAILQERRKRDHS